MRYDEMLARSLMNNDGEPTLRLFQWKPWTISLGYNQRFEDIDLNKCAEKGIDVVKRPTGGRAIFHADELTYSVVMVAGRKSVLQVHNEISMALVRGLRLFGVDVTLQRSQPNLSEHYKRASGVACFTSSARYEIEWEGKKLVGSAQRRFSDGERDIVLQHGSILCGPTHQQLVDYLCLDAASIESIRRDLREKTIDLSVLFDGEIDIAVLSACVSRGFELEWGIAFHKEPSRSRELYVQV
jgi:lipoate-protein ligase A